MNELGSLAQKRESHILQWLYDSRESCTIDQGNLVYAYSQIDTDDNTFDHRFFTTLGDLMAQGLMQKDEPPLDCFYSITDKGIALIEGAEVLAFSE